MRKCNHNRFSSTITSTIPSKKMVTTMISTLMIMFTSSVIVQVRAFQTITPSSMTRMTRTTTQTSLKAFDLLSDIDSFYKTSPYQAAFLTCGIKASAADLLAQFRSMTKDSDDDTECDNECNTATSTSVISNANDDDDDDDNNNQGNNYRFDYYCSKMKDATNTATATATATTQQEIIDPLLSAVATTNQIEYERNVAFILYGGFYQGMAQEYIYNYLFPTWFGSGNDLTTVLTKVAFDLLIISPLICIPIAYIVKALIYKQSWMEGVEKYIHDLKYKNLLGMYYSIWFPAGLCTFGLVPDHLRIAFIAFVSFFWLIILSTVSSSSSSMEEEEEEK